jgi:AraC-like DNA-binding protein
METPPRSVLLMHPSAELAESLRAAVGGDGRVWALAGWDELEAALHRAPPSVVAFVDPFLGEESGTPAPRLLNLLNDVRSAILVAAFPIGAGTLRHLERMVRAGLADVVDVGREDTPAALRQRLIAVRRRSVAKLLDRALPRSTPSRTRALLSAAAETAAAGEGAAEFAAALGATERTVLRWCRRADLPHPRRLLAWLRVLLAADMLDDPGRPLSVIARACGYSGDAALRNALRSFLGSPPGALRGHAFSAAASAFARELFALREEAAARGRPDRTWLH